jgi:DNA-binding transcriptional LysR family regulator
MPTDLDTALARSFLTLAETRSFTRTADAVGRTQSAVSAQLRRLEEIVGARLFERTTRSVTLTADGERMVVHARAFLGASDALLARFREAEVEGEVRFGSPEDFASAYLADILAAFAKAHPKVRLHVRCDLTLHLLEQFADGALDVAIIKQDPRDTMRGARPLKTERLAWVGPPDAVRAFPPADLLPLVLAPSPCVYRSRATAALDRAGVPWSVVFASPSEAGQIAAVRAGLGHAVLPESRVPPDLQALVEGWPELRPATLCLLESPRADPAARALGRFIAEALA